MFHDEMARYCGRRFRVYRCVDKIYDYGRTKRMRRLDGFVLLAGVRCAGSDFDGCEARCYLLWNVAWLVHARRASDAQRSSAAVESRRVEPATVPAGKVYGCQFTQLHHASSAQSQFGILPELRPLVAGNVSLRAAWVSWGTRWFNRLQRWRRGLSFPHIPSDPAPQADWPSPDLRPGQQVHVVPVEQISRTLSARGRNKGLWFDADMAKHCGTQQKVLTRIDRIIDDATGTMRFMKTPCYALDGIDYSGEFMAFNPQHDTFFWRAYWLSPDDKENAK